MDTTLNHEVINDTVKGQPVINLLLQESPEIGSFQACVPSARPTKFATVLGTRL